MFKQYDKPRDFRIFMYCPDGSEFMSFEKVESEYALSTAITNIFKAEYSNIHEMQFIQDNTHKKEKWFIIKNGVTIGYIEAL